MLSDNIKDYYVVSQGKTSIPGVDDAEELELTDVRNLEIFHKALCICVNESEIQNTFLSLKLSLVIPLLS